LHFTRPAAADPWRTFLAEHPELTRRHLRRSAAARGALGLVCLGVGIAGAWPALGMLAVGAGSTIAGATLCLDRGCCRRWLP
jgi:hypothetical protein